MKQKRLLRIMSFVLAFIMLLEIGPIHVFATEKPPEEEVPEIPLPEITAPEPVTEMPEVYIEGEVQELRNEYEKHYRLTDGSFMAVQYQVPVHYEDDGQWVDIDNTLEPVTMFSGDTIYQAVNGENVQAFATDLSDGTIMTMATDDHMISMSIWTYDSTEEAVIEDEPENSVDAEDDAVVTEPMATQEAVPEEPVDSAEASEVSNPDNDLVSDLAFVEEEDSEMSMLSVDETEIIREDATIEEQQDDTIVAQILTEDVGEDPVADTEEAEHWELDDVMPDALRSSILYEDVFPGVDLRYDTFSYNVKESIILKQPMDLDEYAYSFLLTLDGLEPELQEDGSILLLDDDYEVLYTIPAPYMWDAENVYSDAVFYELEETDEGWVLTVCADEDWLEDAERVYPVTIDPSFDKESNEMLFSTAVERGTPNSNSTPARPGKMSCGYSITFGFMEGYVKIKNLPSIPVGCIITEAELSPNYGYAWLDVNCRADVSILKEGLSNAEWSGIVDWDELPEKEKVPMDFLVMSSGSDRFKPDTWDVTPAVMQWYNDPDTNHGLALTPHPSEPNRSSYIRFDSTGTKLKVYYKNTIGIEDYYTYETQSAVRAGTGYVGDFDSSLTVIKNDLSFSSATTPFSVAHVFNSELRDGELDSFETDTIAPDYAKMLMGYGWQLSVLESVKRTKVGDTTYLVYRDGDGTQHYFKKNDDGVFEDEDGLGLKITQSSTSSDLGYTMKDKTENQKYFRNGYLKYIMDTNGNKICYLYDGATYSDDHDSWQPPESGAQLTSIVAARNGGTTQLICSFTYNERNQLVNITDYADRVTTFYYGDKNGNVTEDGSYLVKIKHPDGTTAHYQYNDDSQLVRMFDAEAGYGIEYGYSENGVASIHEYTSDLINGTQTQGTHVERRKLSIQETEYRYDGNDRQFATENPASKDDIVNRYAFDYAGRTINAVALDSNEERILGVSAAAYKASSSDSPAANNRISKTGQSGQNGVNLLKNSGMEYANGTSDNPDWKSVTTQTVNYTGEISSENVRTGQKALKSTINTSASNNHNLGRVGGMYQNVELEANTTYTFSAYVNTNGVDDFSTGSVYAAFLTSNNGIIISGNKLTYKTGEEIDGGWQRIYCTYTTGSNDETGRVGVIQENVFGTVYYDDLQLEVGDAPSTANLLQDANFDIQTNYWSGDNYSYLSNSDDPHHLNVLSVNGDAEENVRVSQRIKIGKVCTDQTFLLSGWGKAASGAGCVQSFSSNAWNTMTAEQEERYFGLVAKCHYTYNGNNDTYYVDHFYMPFNDDYDGWQFASCVIVPSEYYQKMGMVLEHITVYAVYDNNFNTMYVDNLSLRQEPCTTYSYNVAGNISAVNATGSASQAVQYVGETDDTPSSDPRPATVWKSESEAYYYSYGASNKYLPTQIANASTGVYTRYTYDSFGNATSTENARCRISDSQRISDYYIRSSAVYSEDGSQLVSETNGNGQTTSYVYNKYRDRLQTTDSNGTNVVTQEIATNDRPSISYISGVVSVNYSYSNGLLSRINRSGYITGNSVKQNQFYNMSYDAFGNMTKVSISGNDDTDADTIVLASYNYGSNNGHLNSMTYGESNSSRATISYTYDELDRLTKETWSDGTSYQYFYNSEGALSKKIDSTDQAKVDNGAANAVNYEYDSIGRLIHSSASKEGATTILTEHMYDRQNRIKEQTYQLFDDDGISTSYISNYSYRGSDGAITYVDSVNGNFGEYAFEYDDIARLSARYNYYFRQDYDYLYVKDGLTTTETSSQTSTQIANIAYSKGDGGASFDSFNLAYTYDALGNIKTVTGTGSYTHDAEYTYDIQGQLTAAEIDGNNYSYEYDTYGNIREAVKEGVTHNYVYGNADWKDLLTKYDTGDEYDNGEILYEGQNTVTDTPLSGNPISYYNGTRWAFEWEKGRQLVSASSDDHEIKYTYDMAGIRDSKIVKTVVDGQEIEVTYNYFTLDGKVVRQTWGNNTLDIIYDNSGLPYAFKYGGGYYIYVLNQQGDVIRIVNSTGATVAEYRYDAWGNVIYSNGSMAAVNPIRYRGYYYDTETGFYYLQSRYYDPSIGRFINADTFASTSQDFLGYNMFAYCLNNPVNCTDDAGMFALSALLAVGGAVVGGGVAGALIGGISYLVSSGISGTQLTSDGFWGAVGVGAVNGAIGGAAGAAGIALKVGLSLTAGAIAGSYTASNATGTTGQKTWMGIATGIIAAGSTFVGASIDTSNLTPALTAFANYGTTMAVATPAEVVAVVTQQAISSVNTTPAVSTSTRPSPRASRNNYVECMLY